MVNYTASKIFEKQANILKCVQNYRLRFPLPLRGLCMQNWGGFNLRLSERHLGGSSDSSSNSLMSPKQIQSSSSAQQPNSWLSQLFLSTNASPNRPSGRSMKKSMLSLMKCAAKSHALLELFTLSVVLCWNYCELETLR